MSPGRPLGAALLSAEVAYVGYHYATGSLGVPEMVILAAQLAFLLLLAGLLAVAARSFRSR